MFKGLKENMMTMTEIGNINKETQSIKIKILQLKNPVTCKKKNSPDGLTSTFEMAEK